MDQEKNQNFDKLSLYVTEFSFDSQPREYAEEVKFKQGSSEIVRFLDGNNGFVLYKISWILCDDDVVRPFIIENEFEGKNILAKIFGDDRRYFLGGYLESKKTSYARVFTYQAKDPELFKQMTNYYNASTNTFGSCKPRVEFVCNVIHRNPEFIQSLEREDVWCKVFKKTKILRLKYPSLNLLHSVMCNDGSIDEYDIKIEKIGSGNQVTYSIMKAGLSSKYVVSGPVTEEEKAYERWDLHKVVRLSSARYILTNLRNKIERISNVMGIDFIGELIRQELIEREEYEKSRSSSQDAGNQRQRIVLDSSSSTAKQVQVDVAHGFGSQKSVNPVGVGQNVSSVKDSNPTIGVQRSVAQSKTISVSQQTSVSGGNTIVCGHCKNQVSKDLDKCPACGGVLRINCDVCGEMMGYFEDSCKSCGAKYSIT